MKVKPVWEEFPVWEMEDFCEFEANLGVYREILPTTRKWQKEIEKKGKGNADLRKAVSSRKQNYVYLFYRNSLSIQTP